MKMISSWYWEKVTDQKIKNSDYFKVDKGNFVLKESIVWKAHEHGWRFIEDAFKKFKKDRAFVGTFENHIVFKDSASHGIEMYKTIQFVE